MFKSHRTTARGFLVLLLVGVSAGTAQAASVPALTSFPVVGNVHYTDDFGDPRPQGPHEGNDIMSVRHQPAVAFEGGTVKKWVGSSLGTCMLYLYGKSGMTYVYIHLNNDLGPNNDNKGGCKNGISWAPGLQNGDHVRRGQLVGYVGDSGDANGLQPHLHFEVRKPNGTAIDPFAYLNKAKRVLFPQPASRDPITLGLRNAKILATGTDTLTVRTSSVRVSRWKRRYPFQRKVVFTLPSDATVQRITNSGRVAAAASDLGVGDAIWFRTTQFAPSWTAQRAGAGILSVATITLR